MLPEPPRPTATAGRRALAALIRHRSLLPVLAALQAELGDVFRLPVPGFEPVVLCGPEAARFVTIDARGDLRWRIATDPVARLLRDGVLVTDGADHDRLRALMTPSLHRRVIERHVAEMVGRVDRRAARWPEGVPVDLLPEIRRLTLEILTRAVFDVDVSPDLGRLWHSILRLLEYISPGLWVVWPAAPRPGFGPAIRQMDSYLLQLIAARRAGGARGDDLLSALVRGGLPDESIRDQLLTMLIAGHDTNTALFAWALVALGQQPEARRQAQAEVDSALRGRPPDARSVEALPFLAQVIKETLRLYPPIHVGNRLAARDLEFGGYRLPAGTRVLFSIYLTHRHPRYWPNADQFRPERFAADRAAPGPLTFLPFGAGPRYCIGASMAQVEARVVLARLLQLFDFDLIDSRITLKMGATLEPSPGVTVRLRRRD